VIFEAALNEFSQRGLAGARVDRIAQEAQLNKANLYRLFGSKRDLFEKCLEWSSQSISGSVVYEPGDLPSYAVGLFERSQKDDRVLRLFLWAALEGVPLPGAQEWPQKYKGLALALGVQDNEARALLLQTITASLVGVIFGPAVPSGDSADAAVRAVRGAVKGSLREIVE